MPSASAPVEDSVLGRYVEIGERTRISHASFGDYSYMMEDGQVLFSTIGKFCSIAAMVRINPGNHDEDYWSSHVEEYLRWYAAGFPQQ